ncbi:MAG TPA: GNAT family N-acetyltransferase [Symbiobacteriaceae bacterium]|nr:GNAT family N-acetyltransferase [Symbiobacteriaceae bacterium]
MCLIRHAELADYAAIAAIMTLTKPEPYSAEEVRKSDERQQADPTQILHRLVAVAPDGRVVGYGYSERQPWEPEGRWGVTAATHPDERGRGVGTAMLTAAESIAREGGATEIMAWCLGTDDASFAWAQRKGYTLKRQRTESVLDVQKFDPARFAGACDRVRAGGLTLALYEGKQVSEPLLRQIYDLDRVTTPDIPVWDAGMNFPAWEQYRKEWTECPDAFIVALALDGDRVVGMSAVYFSATPGKSAGVGFTGVYREYRGRGIALAVKLMTIEEAMRRGVPRMRTHNDPDNPPMLAVNVKMGFVFVPGPRQLIKALQ